MKRVTGAVVFAAVVTSLLAVGVFAAAGSASSSSAEAATKVKVSASEFKFILSKRAAPAGIVTFVVTNRGKVQHDFKIAGKKSATLSPGKSTTLKLKLKKGRYPYLCTLPGHAAAGMKGVFTVK
jgi:uncharacterized cupredoxin-like copper-binding protein